MIRKIALLVMASALIAGCTKKVTETKEAEAIPVKVLKMERQHIATTLNYTATLVADKQVFYAPASTGRIGKIYVEVGDRIKQGQLLVEMDQTNLFQAEVQLQNLETEYNRAVKLNETGSISRQNYDAAVTNYEVARSNVEFLKENTKMLAPFNGIVTGKFFENGELYTGAAFGGASKPSILAVERVNPVKANVNMAESFFNSVKEGAKVEFRTHLFPDRVFEGKVSIVYPTINTATRTFTVEVKIPNADEVLRPGMYGTIDFYVGETNTLVVPVLSVLKMQGANERYVFLNEFGKARRVSVTLGRRFDDQVEIITDEIREGAQLVVVGQGRLENGTLISVVQ